MNRARWKEIDDQFRQALEQLEGLMEAQDGQGLQDRLTLASAARAHWKMGAKRGAGL